ncbi:DUF2071 domain-containing protein [Subtercola endophyticus]|uniref:DUF2071 domain-containing protein n=1 Tax=Subtercola endophyticus TaxID=2895559 RepID=UPI001E306E3C|nr:DUF2071 domain-containing protein [Subtercola endophyticus]UFS57953.1 DUF2071 domain-containing protein [Subtercola endophyticus]
MSLSPHDISRPILRQQWRNVTFLHWRIDTADAASLMPPGVVPDEFDGSSWVGLVGAPQKLEQARQLASSRATG